MDIKETFVAKGYAPLAKLEQYRAKMVCKLCKYKATDPVEPVGPNKDFDFGTFLTYWDSPKMDEKDQSLYRISRPFVGRWHNEEIQVIRIPHPVQVENEQEREAAWKEWEESVLVDLSDQRSLIDSFRRLWRQHNDASLEFVDRYGCPFRTFGNPVVPLDLLKLKSREFDTFHTLREAIEDNRIKKLAWMSIETAMSQLWVADKREPDFLDPVYWCVMQGPKVADRMYPPSFQSISGKKPPESLAEGLEWFARTKVNLESWQGWKILAEAFAHHQIKGFVSVDPRLERFGMRIVTDCLFGYIWASELLLAYGEAPPEHCLYFDKCGNYLTDDESITGNKRRSGTKICKKAACKKRYTRDRQIRGEMNL